MYLTSPRRKIGRSAAFSISSSFNLSLQQQLISFCSRDDQLSRAQAITGGIDTAAEFGSETAVLHAQLSARHHHWERSRVLNAIYESIQRLYEYAAEREIIVCVENLDHPFIDIADFPELLVQTDTAICLDTGHALRLGWAGMINAFLQKYGDRISHIHLNDTRIDQDDEHLPVGLGRVFFSIRRNDCRN